MSCTDDEKLPVVVVDRAEMQNREVVITFLILCGIAYAQVVLFPVDDGNLFVDSRTVRSTNNLAGIRATWTTISHDLQQFNDILETLTISKTNARHHVNFQDTKLSSPNNPVYNQILAQFDNEHPCKKLFFDWIS
jgi:hypothetical protein